MSEVSETDEAMDETGEVVEMAGKLGKMVGDRSDTRIGETGEVTGRQQAGATAVQAGVMDRGCVRVCLCVCLHLLLQSSPANAGTCWLQWWRVVKLAGWGPHQPPQQTAKVTQKVTHHYMSACSDVSNITTASPKSKYYPEKNCLS